MIDKIPLPTVLDRAITYFDPVRGANRYRARLAMSAATSWVAASRERPQLKTWNPNIRSADGDTLHEITAMRARSRDAVRNIPYARGAISTSVTSIVGSGLQMRPSIDGRMLGMSDEQVEEWQRLHKKSFHMWASSPLSDTHGKIPFYGQQGLAWRSFLENGDVFALTPSVERKGWRNKLTVQLIEADRVSNPNGSTGEIGAANGAPKGSTIHNGIEYSKSGEVVAAHISDTHPGAMRGRGRTWNRVLFRGIQTGRVNVIHLHDPQRIGESRGTPYLSTVVESLKQISRFTEAELAAAVISSMFTVFIETESGMGLGGFGAPNATGNVSGASGQKQYEMGVGAMIQLANGQSVKFADPSRPNDSFDPFVTAVLREVGVALEIPYELLVKHFSSSYTAARASMQEAWRAFMAKRIFFARDFCQPINDLLLAENVANGFIVAPGFFGDDPMIREAFTAAKWIGPPRGQINEKVETQSAVERMGSLMTTLEEETAQATGADWEANIQQAGIEKKEMDQAGLVSQAFNGGPRLEGVDDADAEDEDDENEPGQPRRLQRPEGDRP